MENLLKSLNNLEEISRKTYKLFYMPLYKLRNQELIEALNKIKNSLKLLSEEIIETVKKTKIQYSYELNINKLKLFAEDLAILSNKIEREIILEQHKKEIDSDIIKLKEEITNPEKYFRIEEDTKNLINLFLNYLDQTNTKLKHKYKDIPSKTKSVEELLTILNHKDERIQALNKEVEKYNYLENKEKAKTSKLSELEQELIKKTKASEQDLTILKLHIVNVEKELDSLYRYIKNLNNDISHLEARLIEKEQISLELIRELKDELLATRYILSKKTN